MPGSLFNLITLASGLSNPISFILKIYCAIFSELPSLLFSDAYLLIIDWFPPVLSELLPCLDRRLFGSLSFWFTSLSVLRTTLWNPLTDYLLSRLCFPSNIKQNRTLIQFAMAVRKFKVVFFTVVWVSQHYMAGRRIWNKIIDC